MKPRSIILIFLVSVLSVTSVWACLNGESRRLKSGDFLYMDTEYIGRIPHGHDFNDHPLAIKRMLRELDSLYHIKKDLDYLSDKGVVLIVSGQYDAAIKLYLELERLAPGRYATASNIGTAYELSGNNTEALKWINRAIAINPKSHRNSEWIHAAILEAKIKGAAFINTQNLLHTNFGTGDKPVSTLSKKELDTLANQLYYQLVERMSFVKVKDAIVAQMLHDLGDIEYLLGNEKQAKADYAYAENYGYVKPPAEPVLLDTIKTIEATAEVTPPIEEKRSRPFLAVAISCVTVAISVFVIMRRKKRKKDQTV